MKNEVETGIQKWLILLLQAIIATAKVPKWPDSHTLTSTR